MRRGYSALLLGIVAMTAFHSTTHAQATRRRTAVGIVGGISQFDLSGTGTTGVVALRGDLEARSWLVLEGGLALFRPDEQFGQRRTYAIPEVALQAQVPARAVRPYLGVGIGSLLASGGRDAQRVVSAAGGMRIPVPDTRVDLRAELRVRGIGDSFSGAIAEWTFGGGYRFR